MNCIGLAPIYGSPTMRIFLLLYICYSSCLFALELPESASKPLIKAQQRYEADINRLAIELKQELDKEREKLLKSYEKLEKSLNKKAQKGTAQDLADLAKLTKRIGELNGSGNISLFGMAETEVTPTTPVDLPQSALVLEKAYDLQVTQLAGNYLHFIHKSASEFQEAFALERARHLKSKLVDQAEATQSLMDELAITNYSELLQPVLKTARSLFTIDLAHLGGFRAWQVMDARLQNVVFSWFNGAVTNVILDQQGKQAALCAVVPREDAVVNNDGLMSFRSGAFLAEDAGPRIFQACKQSNQLSIEVIIRTADFDQGGPARILSYSIDGHQRNFTIGQEGEMLVLRLRTPNTGINGADPQIDLGEISTEEDCHLILSYQPGKLDWWINGKADSSAAVSGDFSNWDPACYLVFGDEYKDKREWSGTLWGIRIRSQAMDSVVAQELYGLFKAMRLKNPQAVVWEAKEQDK